MVVTMEDAMDALIADFVQPLLPIKMDHKPSISQQEAVAKQMHAIVLLYNYYHRKQHPQLEFLSLETLCEMAVVANAPLLAYLEKTISPSKSPSLVEKSIMKACNISKALLDHDTRTMETWPVEKVAVFMADEKREKCFLERDSFVKGVFSLLEIEVEGKKAEDFLENFMLSKVESRTGINRTDLRTWYSRQTYSLSKEKSRAVVFLMECSKPPSAKEFVEIPIKDVLNNLKGAVIPSGSIHEQLPVVRFFLLLPYVDIISDWLSKPTSEREKELEKRVGKPTKSNKSPMKINDQQIQVEKELCNGSLREKGKNGNDNPDNKREHNPSITVPCNNSSAKHMTSFAGPLNNCSVKNVTSISEISGNGTLKPVKLGAEVGNNSRVNGTSKEITKDVEQKNGNTSKELREVNSKPCTPTKRSIIETCVKQEIVPFVVKDAPSCVGRLMKIRDDLCENQRKLEDEIAQCEMDMETIRCEQQMTTEVEKIVERWEKAILSEEGQLDASVGCPNPNKKKKFKLRSSCQILDDNCRDNKLALPRYNVHPISNGLYLASATLKSTGVDCMAESELKKNPHEAREHAALLLMQKLNEMEED
ncbi:hypothetical protein FCM35_KLT18125 [Carex littledalei]|uniref:DRBM domain-containing protein n=1 Tax=Carex littledalei TaxID=544730 RepID=A0A833RKY9_9POAL|nr:hypothetical protein FCM35_KLT18125 [Carex littledalei]